MIIFIMLQITVVGGMIATVNVDNLNWIETVTLVKHSV